MAADKEDLWALLPDEVIVEHIMPHLIIRDLHTAEQLCRRMYRLAALGCEFLIRGVTPVPRTDTQLARLGRLQLLKLSPFMSNTLEDFSGLTDAGFVHLRSLATLDLSRVRLPGLTDAGLAALASTLTALTLGPNSHLGGDALLGRLTRLERLHVGERVATSRVTDAGLAALAPRLTVLSLCGGVPHVTDAGIAALTRLEDLRLSTAYLALTDAAFVPLAPRLRALTIHAHSLPNVTSRGLASLTVLEELAVSDVEVTDETLMPLTRLRRLDIGSCGGQVTDAGLAHLTALEDLIVFNMHARGSRITRGGLLALPRLVSLNCVPFERDQ